MCFYSTSWLVDQDWGVLRVGYVCIGGYWEFGHGCYLVVGICVVIWGYSGKVE
jgi:hypothetical protein